MDGHLTVDELPKVCAFFNSEWVIYVLEGLFDQSMRPRRSATPAVPTERSRAVSSWRAPGVGRSLLASLIGTQT